MLISKILRDLADSIDRGRCTITLDVENRIDMRLVPLYQDPKHEVVFIGHKFLITGITLDKISSVDERVGDDPKPIDGPVKYRDPWDEVNLLERVAALTSEDISTGRWSPHDPMTGRR